MKKNLLFSTILGLSAVFFAPVAESAYCACAGRCVVGAVCNCSTGACTIPAQSSRYAYGYVDTSAPTVYSQPTYPAYQTPTPYRTTQSTAYYGTRPVPYIAARLGINLMEGDVEYRSSVDGTWKKDFDDEAFSGALAFGVKLNSWRGELEASLFSKAEKDLDFPDLLGYDFSDHLKASVKAKTVLFNLYYDIPTETRLTPFIGGGVGFAHLKGGLKGNDRISGVKIPFSESHSKINFAWQLGAGVSYALAGKVNLDFAYRYTHYGKAKLQSFEGIDRGGTGKYEKDKTDVKDLTSHSISAGLRFSF